MRAAGAAGQKDAPLANTSRAAFTQKPAGVNNVNDNASAATPHYTSDGTAVGHLKLDLVGKNGPSGMASPPAGTMSPRGAAGARSPRTMRSPRGAMSPRTPRTKGPVTVVEPETPQDGLEVLMGKREGVIAMLNTIRATLFKNDELIGETQGYADDTEEYDLHWLTYRPKGSTSDVLTYRGHEKALDLLRCFDRDHDDMLDFSDFRGYLEYFGRTEEYGYLLENRESWLNYVEDMFETDKKSKVTARGFLMHRQEVEYKYPLSRDLQKLGMDPLTTQARRFRNACVAFDRLDIESQQGSMDRLIKRTGARGPVQPIGKLPLPQLQLLLGDCGECLDAQRGKELMLVHNDHQRVMASLLTRFARKDLKLKPPNLEELEDTMNVYKRGFWAWFMSGRPKQESRWLERSLIQVKNRLKRSVRSYTKMAEFVWKHTMNGIRRGLIVSQVFLPYKQQSARYEAGIKLGRTDKLSGGLMCTLKFHQFDSERAARKKMTMPSASGMAVSMDLLLKTDVQPQQAIAALSSLKKVISEHFESEINKLPRFLSWQVFPAVSDLDNLKVLRVAIYLKADMHVDNLLKQLQLGFSLRDVMSDLVLELRTNLDLRNACEKKDYVLSQHLGMRVNLKTNLCRGILSSLLREVFTSMDDVHQARRTELEHRSKAAQSARERTLETNPQATTRFLRETFKFHYTHRPAIEEALGDLEVSDLEDPATEALLDFEFNDTWGRRMLQLQHYIRNFKAATWDLAFADLNEALFGTAFVKALLPRWLTQHLITSPGAVKEAIDKIRTSFLHEIERIKRHTEESERRALERERAEQEALGEAGRRRKQREKEKADMVKRLQAINNKGLAGTGMQQPQAQQEDEGDDDGTRVGKLRKMRKEQIKTQKAMLDCYSAMAGAIVAPHSVHVTSGRYRLYLHAESLDIWDVFLPVPREAGNKKKGAKKH